MVLSINVSPKRYSAAIGSQGVLELPPMRTVRRANEFAPARLPTKSKGGSALNSTTRPLQIPGAEAHG
jgi:hypothetical protein